jgi:ribosomal protein S8
MSEIYIEKDIYDNHGVLLLVKGSKATEAIVEKLKKHGYIKPEAEVNSGYSQHQYHMKLG